MQSAWACVEYNVLTNKLLRTETMTWREHDDAIQIFVNIISL